MSHFEKKGSILGVRERRDTISRALRQVLVTNQPRDTGPQLHNCCAKTKEVSSHKWINELMTNFVHRKAHAACSNLHSRAPGATDSVCLSYVKDGSSLWLIFSKKVQFFESCWEGSILLSHVKKKVQFLDSCKKKDLILGLIFRKGLILWVIFKKRRFNQFFESERETLSVGNSDKCLWPINHETLGHNYTTTCQDKGSVLPQMN